MKRFLDLADFERDEIGALLELARRLETSPEPHALAGKILGLLFFNPSLRTLASFQAGMSKLGGTSFVITPGQGTWQLETRIGAVMNGVAAEPVPAGQTVQRREERRRVGAARRGHEDVRPRRRRAGSIERGAQGPHERSRHEAILKSAPA